jgi:hypothetical protein
MIGFAIAASLSMLAGTAGGGNSSGLVVLDPSADGALSMTGNSKILIPSKVAYVNSSSKQAVKTVGTALLDVPQLFLLGEAAFGGQSKCTGTVTHCSAPYLDPLASLGFPVSSSLADKGSKAIKDKGAVALSPGYYSGGISITGNATVTLAPGVYIVGGSGLSVTSGNISGEGVTLVIQAGSLSIAGSSGMKLSPPTTGDTAGVVIAQPKANNKGMSLAGGSEVHISGSIYAPGATLTLVGNSAVEGEGPQMGDRVIANMVSLKGTGSIKIGGPGAVAIQLPTSALFD